MFEYLAEFDHVLVMGPQRSGTTIAATIIGADLGYEVVTEKDLPAVDSLNGLLDRLEHGTRQVIQCPALSRWVHLLGNWERLAVVWMRRDVSEIVASQVRIGWRGGLAELLRYDVLDAWERCGPGDDLAAMLKIGFFESHQRDLIRHCFEVDFRDLTEHPLWLPDFMRRDFATHQVMIG